MWCFYDDSYKLSFCYCSSSQLLTKLTFVEFEELLSFVTKVSLSDIDPTLTPLQNMSVAWYQSLLVLLRKEYTETHRYYVSANNTLQYMVSEGPSQWASLRGSSHRVVTQGPYHIIHTYIHTYVCMCVCVYIYIYIYIHTIQIWKNQ